MQLDADEDGEPFFRPPHVAAAPIPKSGEAPPSRVGEQQQTPRDSEETAVASVEVETSPQAAAAAAATVTVEQEE